MKNKIGKELREWAIMLAVLAILFLTGWYKNVAGFLQRGLLETGILQPSITEISRPASYDFQLIDATGRVVNFEEFKGEVVFMNFWATWCPPCIAEMPDIHDLFEQTGDKVKFVMISVDDDPNKALAFVKKRNFKFPVYFLKSGLPATYQASTIPTTYVLSPNGQIMTEEHGLAKYNTEKFRNFLLGLGKSQPPS